MKIKIKESTYRGRPVLSLYDLEAPEEYKEYAICTIGLRKAKAVVCVVDEIKNFIKKNEGERWKNT